MMCCVITRFHRMVGCDLHTADPTFPVPPYLPGTPHIVYAVTRLALWSDAEEKESKRVDTAAGPPMSKVFDIGVRIPHLGVNHPIPLLFLFLTSSSQGHFGVHSVQTDRGPIAVALELFVNPQLQCNDFLPTPKLFPLPFPLPTGVVIAPNTVVAGLTLGDFLAGLLSMALTSVATLAMGFVTGSFIKWGLPFLGNYAGHVTGFLDPLMMQLNNRMPTWLFSALLQGRMNLGALLSSPNGQRLLDELTDWVVGKASDPVQKAMTDDLQKSADRLGQDVDRVADAFGLNDYFNDIALIPTFPLSPPMQGAVAVPASWTEGPLAASQSVADEIHDLGDARDSAWRALPFTK